MRPTPLNPAQSDLGTIQTLNSWALEKMSPLTIAL
jgi:hypothetical protein